MHFLEFGGRDVHLEINSTEGALFRIREFSEKYGTREIPDTKFDIDYES